MNKAFELDAKDKEILRLIATAFVSVEEIGNRLFLSSSTVRRRLACLEKGGYIIRTHGGAVINKNSQLNKNSPLYLRTMQLNEEKNIIASKAVKLISDSDTIFIDSSSTALSLIPHLTDIKNLTVCTNSLKAAAMLAELEINAVFFGGDIIPDELACNSAETAEMISRINADIFFFSCDALSENGVLSDNSKENCYLRLKFMKNAKKKVLLIDDSKLEKQCTYTLCHLKDIDCCICNKPLPEELLNIAKRALVDTH